MPRIQPSSGGAASSVSDSAVATQVTSGSQTQAALRAAFVPFWTAGETVTTGTVRVDSTGHLITRNANGTTRSTYDATEQALWTVVSGGGGGGAITSVNGKTGVVVLAASDVGADASGAAASAQAASLQKSSNLSDLASAATARTNLGLGTAATQPTTAFDAAGAATTAQAAAQAASYPLAEPGALTTSPDGVSKSGLWTVARAHTMRTPSKVVSRFPSGHGWTGGTDDTTVKLYTDRSYRTITNGAGGNFYLSSPTMTAVDFSASAIRLVFRVDDATRLNSVNINAKTDGSNIWQGSVPVNAISGEWCIVTVPRAAFHVAAGAPNWASITALDVFVNDMGGSNPLTFWLAAFELIPDLASTYPSGVFVLEADDGYAGQKSLLAPAAAQRGIPVTYNVISDRFTGGSPGSTMTPSDLRTFQDKYGWQMSCHAYAGADHDGSPSTAATMEASFQRQKQWLHANGLHSGVDHLALCPGTGSPVAEGAMMDAIRRSFRSARVNAGFGETAAPGDPLRLRSILFTGQTVSQLQTNINLVAGAGGALIFTVHDVLTGATNGTSNGLPAIAQTNLASVLDYAAGKGMVFRTRADWLDGR